MVLYCHKKINFITCICGYMETYHACDHVIYRTITISSSLRIARLSERSRQTWILRLQMAEKWSPIHCLWNVYGKFRMSGHLWGLLLFKMQKREKRIFKLWRLWRMWWLKKWTTFWFFVAQHEQNKLVCVCVCVCVSVCVCVCVCVWWLDTIFFFDQK